MYATHRRAGSLVAHPNITQRHEPLPGKAHCPCGERRKRPALSTSAGLLLRRSSANCTTNDQVSALESLLLKLPDLDAPAPTDTKAGKARQLHDDQVQQPIEVYKLDSTLTSWVIARAPSWWPLARPTTPTDTTASSQYPEVTIFERALPPDAVATKVRLQHGLRSAAEISASTGDSVDNQGSREELEDSCAGLDVVRGPFGGTGTDGDPYCLP